MSLDERILDMVSALLPFRAAELRHLDADALRRHLGTMSCGVPCEARDGTEQPCCTGVATIIATHSDALIVPPESTTGRMSRSAARRALVDAVTVAVLTVPGGITLGGRHWCRDHGECEDAGEVL